VRDRFTVITGIVLVVLGAAWLLDGPLDLFDLPWEWVLPVSVIALGLLLALGRSGDGPGKPPSQFERDDAPRVP
jgi:hypothetical protein